MDEYNNTHVSMNLRRLILNMFRVWKKLWALSLIIFLTYIPIIISTCIEIRHYPEISQEIFFRSDNWFNHSWFYMVSWFLQPILAVFASGAAYIATKEIWQGRSVVWGQVMATIRRKWKSFLGLQLIILLITLLGFLVCLVPGIIILLIYIMIVPTIYSISIYSMSVPIMFLGLLACIVPGIIISLVCSISLPIMFIEETNSRESLTRSRCLVKGNLWRIFGYYLALLAITACCMFAEEFFVTTILKFPIQTQILSCCWQSIFLTLLYFDLKKAKKQETDTQKEYLVV